MEVEGATEIEGSILEGDGNTMTSLDGELDEELEDSLQATPRLRRTSRVAKAEDTSKDVANCFGFDEDEDD